MLDMASLVAAIQTDPTLAAAFRQQFIAQRRAAVRQFLSHPFILMPVCPQSA